jgi:hypothetical protein
MCFVLINEKEESSKVSSFLSINQGMWRSFLSSLSLLKRRRRRRRRRRGVKGERGNNIFP